MKILVMVTLAAGVRAWAAGGGAPEREVAVCIGQALNAPEVYRARLKASGMYEEIGVRIEWHSNGRDCRLASGAMEISFSYDTPANQFGKSARLLLAVGGNPRSGLLRSPETSRGALQSVGSPGARARLSFC